MEVKDYEITHFKAGDFQDNFGNYWCSMALKGVGEPVKIAVKDPTQFHEGMSLYGLIETKPARSGGEYLKFKRMQREEGQQPIVSVASAQTPAKKEWSPRDDSHIRAQWAIGQSMTHFAQKDSVSLDDVEKLAGALFVMVDRVKATPSPKANGPVNVELEVAQAQAKRDAKMIEHKTDTQALNDEEDAEFASLMARGFAAEGINLDDIPF